MCICFWFTIGYKWDFETKRKGPNHIYLQFIIFFLALLLLWLLLHFAAFFPFSKQVCIGDWCMYYLYVWLYIFYSHFCVGGIEKNLWRFLISLFVCATVAATAVCTRERYAIKRFSEIDFLATYFLYFATNTVYLYIYIRYISNVIIIMCLYVRYTFECHLIPPISRSYFVFFPFSNHFCFCHFSLVEINASTIHLLI